MVLYEMLDRTLFYGQVMIYTRNAYDQCVHVFTGRVQDARADVDNVWDNLMNEVDQWICGNNVTLIYVKHYGYEHRLEDYYLNSDKWTAKNRPYKRSYEIESLLKSINVITEE